jgi:Integrase core domain/Transposase IS116/IS110/IS902 family
MPLATGTDLVEAVAWFEASGRDKRSDGDVAVRAELADPDGLALGDAEGVVGPVGRLLADGCGVCGGPSGAARLLVEVGDITRFPDRNHFASWTGTAPVDASSGDVVRHRLSRGGNRQINRALHNGWRYVGIAQGFRNRAAARAAVGNTKNGNPRIGTCYVHTVIDDYSRVAYAECHDNETAATAVGVLYRAVAWFAERGVVVERVLSDNGLPYVSHLWRDTCAELGIAHKRTRPRRPQTNGKIERLHRTMADGWAYRRLYNSENTRRAALAGWLHQYNHHRPHSALGGQPPITRLDNLAGHHT